MTRLAVLIVDDSLLTQRRLQSMLADLGHDVLGYAGDGEAAVSAYRRLRPDLVTMDITMPKLDGIGATRGILSEFPDARIVMITALGQEGVVLDALRAGASGYVMKPINADKLANMIDRIAGERAPV